MSKEARELLEEKIDVEETYVEYCKQSFENPELDSEVRDGMETNRQETEQSLYFHKKLLAALAKPASKEQDDKVWEAIKKMSDDEVRTELDRRGIDVTEAWNKVKSALDKGKEHCEACGGSGGIPTGVGEDGRDFDGRSPEIIEPCPKCSQDEICLTCKHNDSCSYSERDERGVCSAYRRFTYKPASKEPVEEKPKEEPCKTCDTCVAVKWCAKMEDSREPCENHTIDPCQEQTDGTKTPPFRTTKDLKPLTVNELTVRTKQEDKQTDVEGLLKRILDITWPAKPHCGETGYYYTLKADDKDLIVETTQQALTIIKQQKPRWHDYFAWEREFKKLEKQLAEKDELIHATVKTLGVRDAEIEELKSVAEDLKKRIS